MAKRNQTPPKSFEEALSELEQILTEIEAGEVGLEESLIKYERGNFLIQHCRGVLNTADAPITFLADPGTIITGRNAKTADGIDLEPGCAYVVIQGFTVNNASGSITRAGIRVTGSDHVTVRANTTDNNGTWGIFTAFA